MLFCDNGLRDFVSRQFFGNGIVIIEIVAIDAIHQHQQHLGQIILFRDEDLILEMERL
jgi:hypothetical protein